jgi:hypothetical protein
MIFANAPDYFAAKAFRETRLVIDSASIVCEISDEKFRLTNGGNDFVVNFVVEFRAIDSQFFVSGCTYTGSHSIAKKLVKLRGKGHGNERFRAFGLRVL